MRERKLREEDLEKVSGGRKDDEDEQYQYYKSLCPKKSVTMKFLIMLGKMR